MTKKEEVKGLALLRKPFPPDLINKLPKGTKKQNDCPPNEKVNCKICGGWHHPKIIHLDYVGHAALTDRLLDSDPYWYWEPLSMDERGLPAFDANGGLWIKLFIHDDDKVVTRIGYGNAQPSNFKEVGSREKEVIGDALRNAAMRFGAALDLWHKGDLHAAESEDKKSAEKWQGPMKTTALKDTLRDLANQLRAVGPKDSQGYIDGLWSDNTEALEQAAVDLPDWRARIEQAREAAIENMNKFPGDIGPETTPFDEEAAE